MTKSTSAMTMLSASMENVTAKGISREMDFSAEVRLNGYLELGATECK